MKMNYKTKMILGNFVYVSPLLLLFVLCLFFIGIFQTIVISLLVASIFLLVFLAVHYGDKLISEAELERRNSEDDITKS